MEKKIRNSDIAKKLGLSATLVSLVLNNKGDQNGIKRDTQEKVIAIATQMDYFEAIKQQDKKSPVEEKPGVVGLLTSSLNELLVLSIAPILQKHFSEIGLGFSVILKDADELRFKRMIVALSKFYSGLILVGETADENTISTLKNISYPFVVLERIVTTKQCNTVTTDFTTGANLVADKIEKSGYKKILIIINEKVTIEDQKMIDELTRSIQQKSEISKPLLVKIRMPDSGVTIDYSVLTKYLKPPHSVEILIVLNADMVYKLYKVLQKNNIRIPRDIALISMEEGIGFDLFQPPVTCVRKAVSDMALKTSKLLWGEIKNSGKSKNKIQEILSPELIEGGSC